MRKPWVVQVGAGSDSMAAVSAPLRRAWIALIGLHLVLLAYAFPLEVVFGDGPLGGADYQTHYQHTHTLLQVRTELGQAWAYDPKLLAGHPSGLIFDVDNKVHFGWCAALVRLGVPLPIAFNLFAVLVGLLAPFTLWLSARLLGLEGAAQITAANQVTSRKMSVREAEALVKRLGAEFNLTAPRKPAQGGSDKPGDVRRVEEELSDLLTAQVEVRVKKRAKRAGRMEQTGEVAIQFGSLDELNGLIERLRALGGA